MSLTKIYFNLLFTIFMCGLNFNVNAQNPGSIMFVGFNADGTDGFAIVALSAIPAGTVLYFTDNNWSGASFSASEGTITWTINSAIAAGNVIVFTSTSSPPVSVNFGSTTMSGIMNLGASGESIYCFTGISGTSPTTFISAYSSDNFITGSNTLQNTGLTTGINAVGNQGENDVCVYVPPAPCNGTISACASQIANPVNWTCEDGAGDQSSDGGIDFPSSVSLAPNVSVLPIEIIYFKANLDDDNDVSLSWATASEIDNDFFQIDRSFNGLDWHVIFRCLGAGNSNSLLSYCHQDKSKTFGLVYYRLSQTDFDGNSDYFPVESVQNNVQSGQSLYLFPNPGDKFLTVQGVEETYCNIQLYNSLGINCRHLLKETEVYLNQKVFDISNLKTGIYFVEFENKIQRFEILR